MSERPLRDGPGWPNADVWLRATPGGRAGGGANGGRGRTVLCGLQLAAGAGVARPGLQSVIGSLYKSDVLVNTSVIVIV